MTLGMAFHVDHRVAATVFYLYTERDTVIRGGTERLDRDGEFESRADGNLRVFTE